MAKMVGFWVKNFGVLKNIVLGRVRLKSNAEPLTPMTAVIGKNGVGKSMLLDAFGFLADCLKNGVEVACDARGGFERIKSKGCPGPIEFVVRYKNTDSDPINYELSVDADPHGRPYVKHESVSQGGEGGKPGLRYFLILLHGEYHVWQDEGGYLIAGSEVGIDAEKLAWLKITTTKESSEEEDGKEVVEPDSIRKLGLATFGSLRQHQKIAAFHRFLEGWYLSYFAPDAARGLPLASPQRHLNKRGDNLGNVVQFMRREHPKHFGRVLKSIAEKIPGIDKITVKKTHDGRLLLCFNDKGFKDPFFAQQMSDGTLKLFAYHLLLEDPESPSFIGIEEPENGLYHRLLEPLMHEFRAHSAESNGSQVFITTHQPYLVNALDPSEVWVLEKGADGFATIRRASDDPLVESMVAEGLPLGGLWYSDYLDAR